MNVQEAQESVANMTVRQLIRRCPKGIPMKEALDRRSRRKRKQAIASEGLEYDEEEEAAAHAAIQVPPQGGLPMHAGADEVSGARSDGLSKTDLADPATEDANFAPQVTIIDGRIVLDEGSLEVTAGRLDSRLEEPSLVIEGNSSVTYGTYMNKTPSEKWQPEETETFFRALAQYGTDFSLIERILPHRTRRQIKLKFKREERENPQRVTESFTRRAPMDCIELQQITAQVQSARAARPNATAPRPAADPGGPALTAPEVPTTARSPSGVLGDIQALADASGSAALAPLEADEDDGARVIVEEDADGVPLDAPGEGGIEMEGEEEYDEDHEY
jgi:hypothetical protein